MLPELIRFDVPLLGISVVCVRIVWEHDVAVLRLDEATGEAIVPPAVVVFDLVGVIPERSEEV